MNYVYCIERRESHGYMFTHLHIWGAEPRSVAKLIEGCVDNKEGYLCTPGELKDLKWRFEALKEQGIKRITDRWYDRPCISITWQHYEKAYPRQYCEAIISVGEHYDDIKQNVPLLDSLVKRVKKHVGWENYHSHLLDPKHVLPVLKKWRGMRYVKKVPFGPYDHRHYYVKKRRAA